MFLQKILTNLLNIESKIIKKLRDSNITSEIPICITHGDFADDNIIFNNNIPYIVDFELVRKNTFLQDIGRIIMSYSFEKGLINFEKVNYFKSAYENLTNKQILLSLVTVWINEVNMWIREKYFNKNLTLKAKRFQDELIYLTINLENIIDIYCSYENPNIIEKYKIYEKRLIRK